MRYNCIYIMLYLLLFAYNNIFINGKSTCRDVLLQATKGERLEKMIGKSYTATHSLTYSNTTLSRCTIEFAAEPKFRSMVVDKNGLSQSCKMFEMKESDNLDEGLLVAKQGSAYYEKVSEWVRGAMSIIEVESRDDKPGTFTFKHPTAMYRIRLNHVSGGLQCTTNTNHKSPFGCFWGSDPAVGFANALLLTEDIRGDIVILKDDFDQFEGSDGFNTRFVATCNCFELKQAIKYSFWYKKDYDNNSENLNSGKTSFEILVQSCESGRLVLK